MFIGYTLKTASNPDIEKRINMSEEREMYFPFVQREKQMAKKTD